MRRANTAEELQSLTEVSLPKASWANRVIKHPYLMPYNRLFVFVLLTNLLVGSAVNLTFDVVSTLVLTNFATAILIRQQHVINVLFKLATSLPTTWPIAIRWAAGKVYHFGGIHVGGFASGTLWLMVLAVMAFNDPHLPVAIAPLLLAHLAVLFAVIVMALPQIRHRWHNQFEIVGRFGAWTSILLFWIQSVLLIRNTAGEYWFFALVNSPVFWVLALVTFSVALPWLCLKKVKVDIVTPSSHVSLSKFNYGVTPFAGSSTDLSRNPLFEWHSFANVPSPGEAGFRLTISRAGDWTGRYIDDEPEHVWVKGIPTAGVGNIEKLFKKVVWVATGSGIGPCLPHLLTGNVPAKLVWATRTPRQTYGDELVNEILTAQPDAVIWDTTKHGKPDLAKLAYQAYKYFDAEAVICISNKKVTFHINHELESRGIPAFGAIWDS